MAQFEPGRPVAFRGGTVLPMDDRRTVLEDTDVLVVGERIEAVGPSLDVPAGTVEIDASGGIVMPGMIDTHRHMWQTAMRGYGADWTLTQYFVWYYLEYGKVFRPEDVYAGNLLSAIESLDAGVTTTVDWSHGLQTAAARRRRRRRAGVGARPVRPRVRQHPGRPVGVVDPAGVPRLRQPPDHPGRRHARLPDGLRRHRRPRRSRSGPRSRWPASSGAPVTTHAGVWGATNDDGIRLMHENGFATPQTIYVHAATLQRGLLPAHRRHRRHGLGRPPRASRAAGQGYPPTWTLRCARHPGRAVDGHQRVVERRPVLRHARHARRRPVPGAPRGAREGRDGHQLPPARRPGGGVGHPRRRPGARPRRRGRQPGAGARRPTSC